MSRSKRMKPVMQVAENREQQAARDLGAAQQRLAVQERKLEELQTYRDQYAQQFEQTGGGGIGAVRMQDYRVFLARLNQRFTWLLNSPGVGLLTGEAGVGKTISFPPRSGRGIGGRPVLPRCLCRCCWGMTPRAAEVYVAAGGRWPPHPEAWLPRAVARRHPPP